MCSFTFRRLSKSRFSPACSFSAPVWWGGMAFRGFCSLVYKHRQALTYHTARIRAPLVTTWPPVMCTMRAFQKKKKKKQDLIPLPKMARRAVPSSAPTCVPQSSQRRAALKSTHITDPCDQPRPSTCTDAAIPQPHPSHHVDQPTTTTAHVERPPDYHKHHGQSFYGSTRKLYVNLIFSQ